MAFTTYAALNAAIADQLARGDLTTQIPDFVTLFEADAARNLFRMRLTETSTNLTPASGSVALPSDYMGWRRVTWVGSSIRNDLSYVPPTVLQILYPTTSSGTPQVFTIEGSTLKIRPTDTSTIEFDYYAKTGALSSSLNWLFTNHPDAYFAGSLEQAYLFVKDTPNAAVWSAKKSAVFADIKLLNFREHGALTISPTGPTP